jgi:CheY-like chemotaxis protein
MDANKCSIKEILIIEDDKSMQEVYQMYFSGHDDKYNIEFEDNGEAGLMRVQTKKYDLIISDLVMEPMTGFLFLIKVRDMVQANNIPILVVSVLNSEILDEIKKFNKVESLEKPVIEEQLMQKIAQMLGN